MLPRHQRTPFAVSRQIAVEKKKIDHKFMIDHPSYKHNLSSGEIKA